MTRVSICSNFIHDKSLISIVQKNTICPKNLFKIVVSFEEAKQSGQPCDLFDKIRDQGLTSMAISALVILDLAQKHVR